LRIIVAGGAGFIGSHLTAALLGDGHDVLILDNYLTGNPRNIAALRDNPRLRVIEHDISRPLPPDLPDADQVYHLAAVVGEEGPMDWRQRDVGALRGRITATDGQHDEGITADLLGHPFSGLAWLAGSSVAAAFGGLRAGQVVMLGSVTPPLWLTGPTTVEVAFDGLPTVRVRLA